MVFPIVFLLLVRFQRAADKTVDDLVRLKFIVEENEPQDWCAFGFFVPKPNGEDVRMVTDYSKINRFVMRPVHPFPFVADIVRSIPAGTSFFAKMDAIHGYFQLALDEVFLQIDNFPVANGTLSISWCSYGPQFIF